MAILTAAQRIKCRVGHHMAPQQSKYGPCISVLFLKGGQEGPEHKIWRSLSLNNAYSMPVGTWVNLIPKTNKAGKPDYDYDIISVPDQEAIAPQVRIPAPEPEPSSTPPTQKQFNSFGSASKEQIAIYIHDMTKLYSFCYQEAEKLMPESAEIEQVQACASSIFIATQRKFNLA